MSVISLLRSCRPLLCEMDALVSLAFSEYSDDWPRQAKGAYEGLFGSGEGRYRVHAEKAVKVRAPRNLDVPFAALIHPSNPDSGAYGGMSFVIFPQTSGEEEEASPALFGLGLGTRGLSPDEQILARPGHARKAQAICTWLNAEFGQGEVVAWAKDDPVRLDRAVPNHVRRQFAGYEAVLDRYGEEMYAIFAPPQDAEQSRRATDQALKAFLDLMFEERGESTLSGPSDEAHQIKQAYQSHFFPSLSMGDAADLLEERQYVILQGPPGTGKTRMALQLLEDAYQGRGTTIQFHPGTTYEDVIGGLAPVRTESHEGFGFRFEPQKGALMRAAEAAMEAAPRPYLLHIDEINRADLAKVLGEAVFLLEPEREIQASVDLAYDFGAPFGHTLRLPDNLHILGTMNTSDRSIAMLDIAIRRRFAFASLWPQMDVVENYSHEVMQQKFRELQEIFIEQAPDDAFHLLPGHSYFMGADQSRAIRKLQTELVPLLEDYRAQGYVAGFEDEIAAYIQTIESL